MRDALLASPDLEQLPVCDASEVPIGDIFGVLSEADSGLVRYFDVAIDGRGRHVLVPVGHARLEKHRDGMRLRLRAATANELDRIPSYEPHSSWHDDVFQNKLLTAFGRMLEGQRYYAHPAYDHTGLYAGAHPLLREPLAPVCESGLRRLSQAPEYRIAEGESDVRGWPVLGENGEELGNVSDLIIDGDAEAVRYVLVQRASDAREVALPIGYVELAGKALRTHFSSEDLAALPVAPEGMITRPEEASLRAVLDSLLAGSRRYLRPDFRPAA